MRKGPYLRPIFALPVDVLATFDILRVSTPEFLLARYCISDDGTTLNPFCLYILIPVFSYTFCIFTECHPFKCRWQVRVTPLPADVLAPSGARPSACTVLTIKLDMLTSTFFYLWRLLHIFNEQVPYKVANELSRNIAAILMRQPCFMLDWAAL